MIVETLIDEIALKLSKGKSLTEKSWIRWADKNRLTRSIKSLYLSEKGIAIDKFAKNISLEPQFESYEESDIIESIVGFTLEYPNRKALNAYLSKRETEQKGAKLEKAKSQGRFEQNDEQCFLKSLKKEMSEDEIIEEMQELSNDPKNYFGKLLITNTCKKDFFQQSPVAQKRIAKEVLKKLNTKPKKPKAKKKLTLNQGLRKLANWISELK